MASVVYRIGYIAEVLGVKPNTVRKWEGQGVVAEPIFRSGETVAYRSYTKGEVDLIFRAHGEWWGEHWRVVGAAVPRPQIFRFGQIYWDLRSNYLVSMDDDYVFDSPVTYRPPDKLLFNPKDVFFKGGDNLFELFSDVGVLLRQSSILREKRISVRTRMEFFKAVYTATTKLDMLELIRKYKEIANNGVT